MARRYAHANCGDRMEAAQQEDEENKEKLEKYIKELFNYTTLPENVKKQIRQFIAEYNYSYGSILRALVYHYEVRHGSKEKAFGRIGIVPYVHEEARNYYLALWQAKQRNEVIATKKEEYILPTVEIHISPPERKPMKNKRKLFTFLEGEEGVNE